MAKRPPLPYRPWIRASALYDRATRPNVIHLDLYVAKHMQTGLYIQIDASAGGKRLIARQCWQWAEFGPVPCQQVPSGAWAVQWGRDNHVSMRAVHGWIMGQLRDVIETPATLYHGATKATVRAHYVNAGESGVWPRRWRNGYDNTPRASDAAKRALKAQNAVIGKSD